MTQNTKDAGAIKRFLYSASIESAAGWQTFYVDAETREEADERAAKHDTDGIYAEEVSVEDLGRLVFDNETAVTDFGDFPLTIAPSADTQDERGEFEADYAKVWNAALEENGWNADHTADDVRILREGNTYGEGRDYLNARWEGWQARAAFPQATATQPVLTERALTDAEIEQGWHKTFSTNNPYCPCNLKTFTKAVRWAEHVLTAAQPASDGGDRG